MFGDLLCALLSLCRHWLRGISAQRLPSPKTHILKKKQGVFMSNWKEVNKSKFVCVRACVCARACMFISSVQMGGRVALAAKWFTMLMSCYLRCCRNNILSFSQWESSLAGADYTAHTAKVVIYIFIQSSGKYKNAHACISGPINKQAELHLTHTASHLHTTIHSSIH